MEIKTFLTKCFNLVLNKKGTIGPHEGQIAQMMLNGTKPICELVDGRPCDAADLPLLLDAAKEGRVAFMLGPQFHDGSETLQSYYFCQPDRVDDMQRLAKLFEDARQKIIPYDNSFHRKVGRLLGYGENDIDTFIKTLEIPNI